MSERDPISDPVDDLQRADSRALLQQHVARLPDELRLPLLLRTEDGLDYRAIGSALRIGESTAHERVQRALGRLRGALTRGGLAALAVDLERGLAMAPAGLEAACLQLVPRATATAAFALKAAAALLALVAVTWTIVTASRPPAGPPDTTTTAASGERIAANAPAPMPREYLAASERVLVPLAAPIPAAAPTPQDPAPAPPVIAGTVHDAAAWPVAGARVVAVAAGGFKPFEVGATVVDAAGAFRLELVPGKIGIRPDKIRLRVLEGRQQLLESDELVVAEAAAGSIALVLPRSVGIATERFGLTVQVVDAGGDPVANAPVQLFAKTSERAFAGGGPDQSAVSDAAGSAELAGRTLGDKWLFVDGRKLGFAPHCELLAEVAEGARTMRVQLAPARSWRGSVRSVDDAALEHVSLWLTDERTGLQHVAELDAQGNAVFGGLGDGTFTLHCMAPNRSPVLRPGLTPGEPFQLRLKRFDDERAHGDHAAELHGELYDAATGEAVPFDPFAVDVLEVRPGESTLAHDRLVPPGPVQRDAEAGLRERFHEVGLPAGEHAIVARVKGYAPAVVVHRLTAGQVEVVRVPLHRGAAVSGVVRGADGAPAAGVRVFVVGLGPLADDNVRAWAEQVRAQGRRVSATSAAVGWSQDDGAFALRDVQPGAALRLIAVGQEAMAVSPPFTLSAGEQLERIDLRLR